MAKFNSTNTNKTKNKSGVTAYKMQDKEKLVSMVLTTMFGEPKFYGDNTSELIQLAEKSDMAFVASLAAYARSVMNLRSVSHALACVVARHGGGELTRRAVRGAVVRADDITEIMSCYLNMYGKPFPNALKRQVAVEMQKFDEYQFAKYNGGNKSLKFRDVLRIVHPVPNTAKQSQIFKKILEDNLETPYTWETELSARGNNKEVWEELIDSGKVGYMALLRNLRNIINAKPNNLDKVLHTLSDPDKVHKSRQLPFRFYSAAKNIPQGSGSKVMDALEMALRASCDNITKLSGKTLIAIDVSGSMSCRVSGKSDVTCEDISCLLGAIANYICEDAEVVTFDTSLHQYSISHYNSILETAKRLHKYGGGTDITLPIQHMLKTGKHYDRVIMLSDNEINSGYTRPSFWGNRVPCQSFVDEYRRKFNPDLWVHAIDLQGYGTQQFCGKNTNILAGWSERVFEYISLTENGIGNLVSDIERYFY